MVSSQITGKGKQHQCVLELNGNSLKCSAVFRRELPEGGKMEGGEGEGEINAK